MKPAAFVYHAPKTLDAALALLAEVAPQDGRVLAGGQSLVPTMAFRLARPGHLVDINGVAGLDRLAVDGDVLSVGATVRHATFEKADPKFGTLGALLADVVHNIAHYPIRTRGTMCGSLAHSDPSSEWCLTAVTLGAEMVAKSVKGERRIKAADYFQDIMTTALVEGELLAEVRLPLLKAGTKHGFYEFSRRAGDFALGAALVTYRIEAGKIVDAHVGVGGIEGTPRRIAEAEAALNGQAPGAAAFAAAGKAVSAVVDPLEDAQTPASYRRDLAATVVIRALERAAA
ncbi:MAG TPA: FAD binding domain-containing protein [Alphaproteobacteria bacterium]|nr:FAD binding domain-containing protein [Alphaproteobacteria bacterium]